MSSLELKQPANLLDVKLQKHSPSLTGPVPDFKDGKGAETIPLHGVWFALLTQVFEDCSDFVELYFNG